MCRPRGMPGRGFGGLGQVRDFGNPARPSGRSAVLALAGLVIAGPLLSACDEKPRAPEPRGPHRRTWPRMPAGSPRISSAPACAPRRQPGSAACRSTSRADTRVVAVCGQVNPAGREDQAFIPFVSVVTYARRPDAGPPEFDIEQYVATSNAEATRMYIEMTSRCGENGGPRQVGNRQVIPPLPPLPSDLPDQIQPPSRPAPAVPTAVPVVLSPAPAARRGQAGAGGSPAVRPDRHHAAGREHPRRAGRRQPACSRRPERALS